MTKGGIFIDNIKFPSLRIEADERKNKLDGNKYGEDDRDKPENLVRRRECLPPLIELKGNQHHVCLKVTQEAIGRCRN